jgi:hypothetical protein
LAPAVVVGAGEPGTVTPFATAGVCGPLVVPGWFGTVAPSVVAALPGGAGTIGALLGVAVEFAPASCLPFGVAR